MANVIKYWYTTILENTIRNYPFVIGVNFGGYGSTAATGYWNGKTPNVSGYTIYQANGVSSPTIYVANNDAQLISLCNQFFGNGVTTVGGALQTFNNSSSICCVNVDYSNIVTTNLGLNLDAGYTASYPRTGTTWTDISGSLNNGTLVNGPVYDGNSGGCIVFDGSDDFVAATSASLSGSAFTLAAWVKPLVLTGSSNNVFLSIGTIAIPSNVAYLGFSSDTSVQFVMYDDKLSGTIPSVTGNWNYVVSTLTTSKTLSIYYNGSFVTSKTMGALYTGNTDVTVGCYNVGAKVSHFNGCIANVQIYNRVLSATEVLQNYYAGLQRFIPTDGLVLYLDGNNTNKQVMTASTANDISGNNYNGTLTNGVALARDGQRSFSFDGIDDYISLTGTISLGNTFTIISWIKLSVVGGTYNVYGCVANGSDNWFGVAGSVVNFRGTELADINNFDLNGVTTLSVGVWYQIAVTVNVSTVTIYLNGVVENSVVKSFVIATWNSNGGNDIGRRGGINSNFFNGNIGQVRAYNTVLSTANILTIYTAGKQRYGL